MHLVVLFISAIGGLFFGLILATIIARILRTKSQKSSLPMLILYYAFFTVPISAYVIFTIGFSMAGGKVDFFNTGPDVPSAWSAKEFTKNYPSGALMLKGERTKGSYASYFGKLTAWYYNGQIAFERNYDTRKPFSKYHKRVWTEWHPDGQLRSQRVNLENDDLVTQWHINGQKHTEGNFKRLHFRGGARVGIHREWYENGQLKCEWQYGPDGLLSTSGWDSASVKLDSENVITSCPVYKLSFIGGELYEPHPFEGVWKPDLELTLEYAQSQKEQSEKDVSYIKRVVPKVTLKISQQKITAVYEGTIYDGYPTSSNFRMTGKNNNTYNISHSLIQSYTDEHVLVNDDIFYITHPKIDFNPIKRLYFRRVDASVSD